eukprot:gb/GECH01009358.1/.p1 GENE.gb/GECH01009358.1/~~gb/GECH01009358.1/.p1  ORF type:complete len:471 (+),score=76.50 gb/GECH01009358.1/:1-1413(+)
MMGYVFVQVGQCGNQVGREFWKCMKSKSSEQNHTFFDSQYGFPRCVLVDSEAKVVSSLLEKPTQNTSSSSNSIQQKYHKKQSKIHFDPRFAIYEQVGRGNNWAMGYNGVHVRNLGKKKKNPVRSKKRKQKKKPEWNFDTSLPSQDNSNYISEKSLNLIRKQIESLDYCSGLMFIHSMGGGTGSGLGCRLMQEVQDNFSSPKIMSIPIFPFHIGECSLQYLNSILTISHLQQYADCICTFDNNIIMNWIQKNNKKTKQIEMSDVGFGDLNKYIADCLVGLMSPITQKGKTTDFSLENLISNVIPSSNLKFTEVYSGPISMSKNKVFHYWRDVTTETVGKIPRYDESTNVIKSLRGQCIIRGDSKRTFNQVKHVVQQKLNRAIPASYQVEDPWNFKVSSKSILESEGISANMTLCLNRTSVISKLNRMNSCADEKIKRGAFMHWYKKYGVEQDDFENALASTTDIIEHYRGF